MLKQTFRLAFVLSLSRLPASAQNYVLQSAITSGITAPENPVADSQGNIYSLSGALSSSHYIYKYNRSGQFSGYFAADKLYYPYNLAADKYGSILVMDEGNYVQEMASLKRFDPDGNLLFNIALPASTEFDTLWVVTPGRSGDYFLSSAYTYAPAYHQTEYFYLNIYHYSSDGKLLSKYAQIPIGGAYWNGGYSGSPVYNLAADSKNNLFLAVGGQIIKIDTAGNTLTQFNALVEEIPSEYQNIAVDAQDRIFAAEAPNIMQIFDDTGNQLNQFNVALYTDAYGRSLFGGISSDQFGNLYVADYYNNRIDILAPSTNVAGTVAFDGVTVQAGTALPNVTVQFRAPGTTAPLFTRTVTLTPDSPAVGQGAFTIANVPPGTYDLAFKASNSLQTTIYNVPVSGMGYGPNVFLRGGDANNDNAVDSSDFGMLIGAYNSALAIPGSGYDASADFNFDGSVDSSDFFILIGNFNETGDL